MEKPWKFYNDMCVRTFVRQCSIMSGRDFAREQVFNGTKHVALDDCRHQVAYLVKARDSLVPSKSSKIPVPCTSSKSRVLSREGSDTISKMLEDEDNTWNTQKLAEINDKSTTITVPLSPPHDELLEPIEPAEVTATMTSLSLPREESHESILSTKARPPIKNGSSTPSTSFSNLGANPGANPGQEIDLEEVKLLIAAVFLHSLKIPSQSKEIDLPSSSVSPERDCEDMVKETPIKQPLKQLRCGKIISPVTKSRSSQQQADKNKPPSTADAAYDQAPSPTDSRPKIWFSR